jgi:O-antigen ligase
LIIGLALFVMLSAVLIYPLMEVRIQRFEDDKHSINQLYAGDIENVPYSSMGIRLHTWVEAWKWIKQRPITGWDYSIRKHVFAESKALPPQIIKRVGHFHNSYIEVLLSYGIIGILYIFSLFYMVMRETWRAWRLGILPGDIFLFGVAFAIFWVIVNFSESYFLWSTGVYLMALVGGCMYTFPLSMRLRT